MSIALPIIDSPITTTPIFKTEPKPLPDTFVVYMTDEDVLLGRHGDATRCPIARALTRTLVLGGYASQPRVYVGGGEATWDADRQRYAHDGEAFIGAFDHYAPVVASRVTFRRAR